MADAAELKRKIFAAVRALREDAAAPVSEGTPLIGEDGALSSMKLVELCLALEDMAAELDFEFDWTSDAAMSRSRGMFRTAGALADEFLSQMARKR